MSKNLDIESVNTKAVRMHNVSMDDALNVIRRCSVSEGFDFVVTPNVDHVSRMLKPSNSPQLYEAYSKATLSLCDSRILEKLLKFKGVNVKEVIPGSSLTQVMFNSDLMHSAKVAIIGGESAVVEKVKSLYPAHKLSHYNPPMGFINSELEIEKTLDFCASVNAQYYFLAVGSPRQEILALRMKQRLKSGVGLCVGASILMLCGEEKRAPYWLQALHLEWLFRMMQNPKVLVRRYWSNFLMLPTLYKHL